MADLFDRLFSPDPDVGNIAVHSFHAAIVDYGAGETTRQQIIDYWALDSEAQTDLGALCDAIDALVGKVEKLTFGAELHAVMLMTEQGAKYTSKTAFKTRLGL
jgi:hypothetical protein